ncbi:hypothetical protein L1987_35089 [Smallanthus sonchifolius]|uniref:Uncharacterized protein n=1 Tax=Smallanthus sonchifolius TaxID=185202 RepID=A0ACB9HWV7_9ASTR|nr:hypothetical protein L1987_35089 [Smallanthus sonchifolius]
MPLWSSSVMLSALVGMFNNFIILQALTMDRHLGGSKFKIPASSFLSLDTLATSISIFILDRLIFPMWQKLTGWSLTPVQQIGLGHVLNALGLVTSALVEVRRLHAARDHHLIGLSMGAPTIVPISALCTSTAMISLLVAVGFYLSTAITGLIRNSTSWLKDDLNDGRLDIVYWVLAAIGVVNFGYFLVCAKMFKHKLNKQDQNLDNVSSS